MIWYWLTRAISFLRWLLVPPPVAEIARVKPTEPCPVCGHRSGTIRAVVRDNRVLVQRTCGVCGARFHITPVVKLRPDMVWYAVPRTEQEMKEEQDLPRHPMAEKKVDAAGGKAVQ